MSKKMNTIWVDVPVYRELNNRKAHLSKQLIDRFGVGGKSANFNNVLRLLLNMPVIVKGKKVKL